MCQSRLVSMNNLAKQFYEDDALQATVISDAVIGWDELQGVRIPRGWFELSRVSASLRVEFARDFWLDLLPYNPFVYDRMAAFFEQLDDVAVVIAQERNQKRAELVYSLADNSCFFRGLVPASEQEIMEMQDEVGHKLPRDYCSFLRIHSGFGKLSEIAMISCEDIAQTHRNLIEWLMQKERSILSGEKIVDPTSLIPFFESKGLNSFQCFFADWYPNSEMGNVYLSGIDYTASNIQDRRAQSDTYAFVSFEEWLIAYLEGTIG
ncbi:MAG: hypothetical protein RL235_215 [Chlamydiota bacterium]